MTATYLTPVCLALLLGFPEPSAEVSSLMARIKAVGAEGKGNVEAAKAWQELVAKGPDVLIDVLGGLDDANTRAANWLRGAVDAIAEKSLRDGKGLPTGKLEAFLRDTRHDGRARRLAYEWLLKVDAGAAKRILPEMLNDPGQELRRDAVDVLLKNADKLFGAKDKAAAAAYQKALEHARDADQVNLIAERLKKLGVDIDVTAHYGFVTRWLLAGPFDNVKGVGFHKVYAPEMGVDPTAAYEGKEGKKVTWSEHVTKEENGIVDLVKVVGPLKGAIYYGYTVVSSNQEKPVEIRAGSNNAVRIFLNGKEVYFREEYHHGMKMDQHVGRGVLKAGRNEILIKVCQNEQTESWAQQWSFQVRICDALGAAVPVTVITGKNSSTSGGR